VEQCLEYLIGHPEKGGHYFTIWAPRQTGKTWLMRKVVQEIPERYGDRFAVCHISFEDLYGMEYTRKDGTEAMALPTALSDVLQLELPGKPVVRTWTDFRELFSKVNGLWDRPLLLLIDEVDTASPDLLDMMVRRFRQLYLDRESNWLHGLALTGVRAVLGVDSRRGSPFNIQRSLHVPNLTPAEVESLYQQYQEESGQAIEPAVVRRFIA
jgi:hypothetical protein